MGDVLAQPIQVSKRQFLPKVRHSPEHLVTGIGRLEGKRRQNHANRFLTLDLFLNDGGEGLQPLPGPTLLLVVDTISLNDL